MILAKLLMLSRIGCLILIQNQWIWLNERLTRFFDKIFPSTNLSTAWNRFSSAWQNGRNRKRPNTSKIHEISFFMILSHSPLERKRAEDRNRRYKNNYEKESPQIRRSKTALLNSVLEKDSKIAKTATRNSKNHASKWINNIDTLFL